MNTSIGELETLILLAVLRLEGEAYGVSIRDEIAARTGRCLSRGAIYTALRRLERKGLVASVMGEPSPERGGRAKRFFGATEEGIEAVRRAACNLDRMRQGLDALLAGG